MTHSRQEPGGNDAERTAYHLAQQQLRSLARRGHALEVDEDGAPMPAATGTSARHDDDPDTLASSMPALKARAPAVLGAAVRLWRRRCNLSTAEVAERAGLARRLINELEGGGNASSLADTLKVLDALGLELLVRARRSSSGAPDPSRAMSDGSACKASHPHPEFDPGRNARPDDADDADDVGDTGDTGDAGELR